MRVRVLVRVMHATWRVRGFSLFRYVGNKIRELDAFNPQVAARMTTLFGTWAKYNGGRQQLMQAELVKIRGREGVSRETFEIAKRSLAGSEFE